MPQDALEQRLNAIRWLDALETLNAQQPTQLHRPLYLVAGLTDETGGCWLWIDEMGKRCIGNWSSRARIVPLGDTPDQRDFVDFGYFLRDYISQDLGDTGGTFDVVCHSMGGLDTFVCLVDDEWQPDRTPTPMRTGATNWITLDTPFRGFVNYDARMQFSDIKGNSRRESQTTALAPGAALLDRVIANRSKLSHRAQKVTCYSAEISTAKEVETSSSDMCSDLPLHVTPWAGVPAYTAHSIPAVSHSGASGITASEITIARVFDQLLFR